MEIRFEKKWKIPQKYYYQLINSLYNSNFQFSPQFKERTVNSIYFDDQSFKLIRQNLDGNNKKKKIRVRWYGLSNILSNPYLEIKKKTGFLCIKEKKK